MPPSPRGRSAWLARLLNRITRFRTNLFSTSVSTLRSSLRAARRWSFLCSPTATRGVEPASSCRARAPAVTTNSNELGSLDAINHQNRPVTDTFRRRSTCGRIAQPSPLGENDAPQPIDAAFELVVHDHVIVLGERRGLVARHLEAPLDGLFAVLAAAAQPLLEHLEGRRHARRSPIARCRARTCRAPWTSITRTRSSPPVEDAARCPLRKCRRDCRRRRPTRGTRRPAIIASKRARLTKL